MRPDQYAELFCIFEDSAIRAEEEGTYSGAVDAKCIRRQAEGLIESMAIVEMKSPGFLDEAIQMMRETTR